MDSSGNQLITNGCLWLYFLVLINVNRESTRQVNWTMA